MNNKLILFIILVVFVSASCKVDPKIIEPLPTDNLTEVIPEGWPQPKYTFSTNIITEDKFILGRELFYETMLSSTNDVSCATCHQDFAAFANAGHDLSHGIYDRMGTRNAPGLFNLNWHPNFMHDGGVNHIEIQPLAPITNTLEMGDDINPIIQKLQASSKYKALFQKAFGSDSVTSKNMLLAFTVFQGMLYSYNSKYDNYKRHENNVEFTDSEYRGYNLFLANCNTCHKEPLFSDFEFRNNGLSVNVFLKDTGRAHITGLSQDKYKFKTPSLRNVAKTAPYMHDGRFGTLSECIDHYTKVKPNLINLDPVLQNNVMSFTTQDKEDIIAFLNTLTDYKFINDKRFSNPNK